MVVMVHRFKIKFAPEMKAQERHLEHKEPKRTFRSEKMAYLYGIARWGSGSFDSNYGWYVKKAR